MIGLVVTWPETRYPRVCSSTLSRNRLVGKRGALGADSSRETPFHESGLSPQVVPTRSRRMVAKREVEVCWRNLPAQTSCWRRDPDAAGDSVSNLHYHSEGATGGSKSTDLDRPPAPYNMFTARAARSAIVAKDMDACTIISVLAQRESTGTSVGENAVLVLNARNR